MKGTLFKGLTLFSLFLAHGAHADFTFHSNNSDCESLFGSWSGAGSASHWLVGNCKYEGSGTISMLDKSGHFRLGVNAEKRSGPFLCPQQVSQQLNGSCENGTVTVNTEYGELTGMFSTDTGSAKGSIKISPGVDVDVAIHFKRTS